MSKSSKVSFLKFMNVLYILTAGFFMFGILGMFEVKEFIKDQYGSNAASLFVLPMVFLVLVIIIQLLVLRNIYILNDGYMESNETIPNPIGSANSNSSVNSISNDHNRFDTESDKVETRQEFYPNGSVKIEKTFKSGLKHGVWTYYRTNGEIDFREEYINGTRKRRF
jgi:hypothetical protein